MREDKRVPMRRWRRLGAAVGAVLLLASCAPEGGTAAPQGGSSVQAGEALEGSGRMDILREGSLVLSVDFETLNILVTDEATGREWATNPPAADEDLVAGEDYKPRLKAQFDISYLANRSVRNIDSYTECAEKERYQAFRLENGVRIVYTLGDLDLTAEDLPQKLSTARAVALILKNTELTEEQKDSFTACYETEEATGDWVWKSNNFGSKLGDVLELFQTIGYTAADLQADCQAFGLPYTPREKLGFRVPVDYTLEKGVFRVSVDAAGLEYPADYPLLSLNLCPYFGAADSEQDGYILLPDGSGALMEFDKEHHRISSVDLPIYGRDLSVGKGRREPVAQPVLLPVFGLKTGSDAFMAVVEEGEALGTIHAERAGSNSSYNAVGTTFTLRAQDSMDLSGVGTGAAEVGVLQRQPYAGRLTVAYRFLHGEEADYAGMARAYRRTLVEEQGYRKADDTEPTLYVETVGAVQSSKNVLGVNYQGVTALTTYAQSAAMARELAETAGRPVKLRLTGWLNGGYDPTALNRFKPVSALGSREELNDLLQSGNAYLDATLLTAPTSKNVSLSRQAARTIDQRYARTYRLEDADTFAADRYILSAGHLPSLVDTLLKGLERYDNARLALADLGTEVYADYAKGKEIDRQQATLQTTEQVRVLEKAAGRLLLNGATARTGRYAGDIVNAPLYASGFAATDREVPFYAMVMHGLAGYAGAPMNLSSTRDTDLLKAVESGAGLYYRLAYTDVAALSGVTDMDLYAVHYADWKDECAANYQKLRETCAGLNAVAITDHRFVTDTCTVTTYENGAAIAVNYGTRDVQINGQTVAASSFARLKER